MNVIIYGKNLQLTEAMKRYIIEKISRFDHFFIKPQDTNVHVSVSIEKEQHCVEVTIPLNHTNIRAEAKTEDMYKSIDKVEEKVKRQIRKFKTKINRKQRRVEPHLPELPTVTNQLVEKIKLTNLHTKKFDKPMNVEEAILQMELYQLDHLYFLDDLTNELRAVYKHPDGKYGLITPSITDIVNRVG
jgi:putative sigma-54 modulation protein